ncbi:MAG TPA: dTDP-4-dehydrorhamnose reductase [Acidimicrobiales bacterium]|nr:dTDP-4-dehydrorhamnose reductase [Acidimicrobiales bacterium]
MRVLVTGAEGQVGHELVGAFEAAGHEVVGTAYRTLDVAARDAVLAAITTVAPDAVVNAAAWTAVDACEADPDRAFAVNALGVRHVVEAARLVGAHLCHFSTDYVFSGDKQGPYHEWDEPDPRSVYGRSKLAGERELAPGSTLVRTSWVCGRVGANLVKTVLRLAGEHDQLAFVDDQHGCLTVASDLAATVCHLVVGRRPGTFHVTNQGATTWYEVAAAVLAAAGLDPGRVRPIATAELDPPRPAPRPANSVLDNAALRLGGLPLLPPWQDSLAALVRGLTSAGR